MGAGSNTDTDTDTATDTATDTDTDTDTATDTDAVTDAATDAAAVTVTRVRPDATLRVDAPPQSTGEEWPARSRRADG